MLGGNNSEYSATPSQSECILNIFLKNSMKIGAVKTQLHFFFLEKLRIIHYQQNDITQHVVST